MNRILTFLFFFMIGLSACQDDNDNTDIVELEKQVEELKALLEQQNSITTVTFEGSDMLLTFANGSTVRTAAPTNIIPYIGDNGNWWVNGEDLGVKAEAQVPTVGSNGNWWIGDTDTGVKAKGQDGVDGSDGTGIKSIDYDPETAILKIILTDGTEYEYQLFYEDAVRGIKLGDLNGKYLLKGITNGDFPFADFIYNAKNQLTDINYYVSLLNAPVKNASLIRTYANDKIETQSLVEYAIKDKAVQVGESFPNSSYDMDGNGSHDTNAIELDANEAFSELFPSGVANFSGTSEEFFKAYRNNYHSCIKKGNYLYRIIHHSYWDQTKEESINLYRVAKMLIKADNTIQFAISEISSKKYIWTPNYDDWNGEFSWYDYGGDWYDAYEVTDINYSKEGYFDIQVPDSNYKVYPRNHHAVEYTSTIDEVTDSNVKDYIAFTSDELVNPENITGNYKILYKEYNRYKQGDEINRINFAYAYEGENPTVSTEGENLYKLKVVDGQIDAIIGFDVDGKELEALKLNYTDGLLTTISSPANNVTDVVKVLYDSKNNPTEFQVNSKDLAYKDMGELLTNLGLAYRTDVYDEELGMVVEKYVYTEGYTPLLKVKYDYTMKNFMNHTVTASNPLLTAFNSENAIQELIWAGHGSCFFAEYMDYNDGGYPQKVKGYLQLSPFYEYGDDTENWDDYDQNDSFEYPVNGSVATSYKLHYQKIEE